MTARSRERGSHAGRSRGGGLPFTLTGLPGLGTVSFRHGAKDALPRPTELPPVGDAQDPPGGPPPLAPPEQPQGHGNRRHRKPSARQSALARLPKQARLVAAVIVIGGALGVGLANGSFGQEASAEPTVQAFLIDWAQGNYARAAALTNGPAPSVRTQLAAAYTDLDATSESFTMEGVTQHGSTAEASYLATVDLAETGQQWSYVGKFRLTAQHGQWVVDWAPSVINPLLGAGDRLAVETAYAPRASVDDMNGKPLLAMSQEYQVGVYPGKLKHAAATAARFADLAGLDGQQVLGQIQAAPPHDFLSLLILSPADFGAMWPRLSKVPGLSYAEQPDRLFTSPAQDVVGTVGTENSVDLRKEGAAYQPGMTMGQTGLEQTYQDSLVGTPTTSVVVVNAVGQVTKQWELTGGHAGTPVQTTLDLTDQQAAVSALAGQPSSAEIIAVDSTTGAIRTLATHSAGGVQLPSGGPLAAKVEPGMAFSIVSAAALLSIGVTPNRPLPCEPVADVGGVTFTYRPATTSPPTFAGDFADGCGTAFANMSRTLNPQQLSSAERGFGIGADWQLQLPSFSGQAPAVSNEADVAAAVTGVGGVRMSPLSMATVAAEVASGTGHSPTLISSDRSTSWAAPLSATSLTQLRQLMRLAVASGSAHAADLPGTPVYGQAGVVQTGKQSYLSWFVGYRGTLAVAVLESGSTPSQAAAALAGTFLKGVG